MVKYSVLMSIYRNENDAYLRASIQSMLIQTVKPDEIVIVKDGELTSELEHTLREYDNKYEGLFKYVELKENVGLGLALNAGLKICDNELIARMDTDDISLKDRCEKQLLAFEQNPELTIVGSNTDEFYDSPDNIVTSREVPNTHEGIMKFSRRRSPFNHPTVMYRKNAVLASGGYSNLRRNQDYDLFIRMLNTGSVGANIDESLLLFRANRDNDKRRKSWERVKLDIALRYSFWRKGYHDFSDFFVSCIGLLTLYLSPSALFSIISSKLLRKPKK